MSEIRATTISDETGNGPIALTKQKGVKAYSNTSGASAVNESFNVSSTADSATTGRTDINLTSAMSSSNYVVNSTSNGTSNDAFVTVNIVSANQWKQYSFDGSTRTDYLVGSTAHGDLA